MKVLVLGSGGREHALVWKIRQSPLVERVYCVPGNPGMAQEATLESGDILNACAMAELATRLKIDLTVVGPEAPLAAGVVDEFSARGLRIVGPSRAAAQLEASKIFAKEFMRRHKIPTADFAICDKAADIGPYLERFGLPVVLKADGLAAGKGVIVARDPETARTSAAKMLSGEMLGDAGRRLLIERFLPGEEVTFIVLADGRTVVPLAATQDHKAAFDNDLGPNTGGMGAYCDDAILPEALRARVLREIVQPTLDGMVADGMPYRGFLYFGLMIAAGVPYVLEYNARLGDPETQPLMMRMSSDLVPLLEAVANGSLAGKSVEWAPGATVCVVAASRGYPGDYEKGKIISGLAEAEAIPRVKVFHAGTKLVNGQYVTAGGRVLGITAAGAGLREAITTAYRGVEQIHFEGMHYRRDIGKKGLGKNQAA